MEENKNIQDILTQIGIKVIDRQESDVLIWQQFYEGNVKKFHEYIEYQGNESVTRKRKSLHMAKVISELWSDNIINPETNFFTGKSSQEWLDAYVDNHNIKGRLNAFYELVFAFGIGATVQYRDIDRKAVNQYVRYDNIYPFEVINGEITGCAFASQDNNITFVQIHRKQGALWVIQNLYFDESGKRLSNEGRAMETFLSQEKLYQIHQPAIVNNINIGNPMGLSVFANAIEELKSVDIAYDALDKEIRNGRMRVYIQGEALVYNSGSERPLFNKDQDEFYLLPPDAKNPDGTLIKVEAPTLRVEQLIENLKTQLNLLGAKCGLGDNAFYSDGGSIYTNTEQVVSSNSKFYKTRTKHATNLHTSLVEMIKGLYYLEHDKILTETCYVEFDDSIIHDKDAEYNRTMQLFNAGLIDRIEVYMQIYKMSEKEAIEFNNKMTKRMALPEDMDEE